MEIGDIVWRSDYGMGRVVGFEHCLAPCLVYFYKENKCLHNGNGRGSDCHYWLCMETYSCPFSVFVQANRKEKKCNILKN